MFGTTLIRKYLATFFSMVIELVLQSDVSQLSKTQLQFSATRISDYGTSAHLIILLAAAFFLQSFTSIYLSSKGRATCVSPEIANMSQQYEA
ncbi:hypothetical protein BDQ17DRAFT_1370701 [Cyathus striatus]|nr:hypothetical protein BDQ17DRAFT_1370701 [Cyathus striatus]